MYERFTDRSRRVIHLANQEAQQLQHEYIATEHILLGLIKEGSGVAAVVLKNLNVDLNATRLEIEKMAKPGTALMVTGKLSHAACTKKTIELATEFAREHGDCHVGTEHLLVGLLREKEGLAYQILQKMGVAEQAFTEVLRLLGENPESKQKELTATECDAILWQIYVALTMHTVKGEDSQTVLKRIAKIVKETSIEDS